jgi:hypothetical protein
MSGTQQQPKKILLEAWAERYFDPVPSLWTLRTMARTGRLRPAAVKVGKHYYVDPEAVVIDPNRRQTLVERMQQA